MTFGSSEIRQRKGISRIVENFDIFEKVVENVKEEKKVSSGAISVFCFIIIFALFCSETYSFAYSRKLDYRFTLDTESEEMPLLDMDIIIATPCNILQVVSTSEQNTSDMDGLLKRSIQKSPTRFEFTDEEQMYWTVLRHAHNRFNQNGKRALEELEYVDDDIETHLENLANEKQEAEAEHLKKLRMEQNKNKPKGTGQIMFLVSNGMGMFQLLADTNVDGAEGDACRLHGKFRVRKGQEEKIVMSINNPLIMFGQHDNQSGNISHRIEKFNFGPRIPGLVTPLAGAEHISASGQDIYRYFIKVVPTKVYGYFGYTMSYQYSVTFLKKKLKDGEHSHGGILFEYEFSANVIEIRRSSVTLISYLTRICSILGGVYATSTIVNNIVQFVFSFLYQDNDGLKVVQKSCDSFEDSLLVEPISSYAVKTNMSVH
uniref:Endoplasmic reticulum vesicle transporter C-terminal domain-containing protein n=1 Tax=Caenorhabditis japonica TaxID=281687 RepID=A0A8R1DS39_CAEJA